MRQRDFGLVLRQEDVVTAVKMWMVGLGLCGLVFGLDELGTIQGFRGVVEERIWAVESKVVLAKRKLVEPLVAVLQVFERHKRIAALEEQLAMMAVDQQRLKELAAAAEFEGLGDFKANTLAEIYTDGDVVVIGAGQINGVLPGMAVTDKNNILVGKVDSVGRYVSRVLPVGSGDYRVPGQTVDGSAKGVVFFDGMAVVFGEVLQTEPLEVGEVVVTGGVEGDLPAGLVIGQIVKVINNEADVTKKGELQLLYQKQGWAAVW